MIDRYGKTVYVAWHEHEILWVLAANTLTRAERCAAYHDIASMRGCTFAQVSGMAHRFKVLAAESLRKARLAAEGFPRAITPPTPIPPSQLNQGARMQALRVGRRA